MTGYLLHKTGALAAFRAYGKGAGAAVATGAAAGATGAAAAGGWKHVGQSQMGKQFGVFAAICGRGCLRPRFRQERSKNESSSKTRGQPPTVPKEQRVSSPKIPGLGIDRFGDIGVLQGPAQSRAVSMATTSSRTSATTAEDTFKKLKGRRHTRSRRARRPGAGDSARSSPKPRDATPSRTPSTARQAPRPTSSRKMRRLGGKNLQRISQVVADTTFEIKQRFGPDTTRPKTRCRATSCWPRRRSSASMK